MQDLAVVSSLGLTHTERNSYHYFKGLTPWPTDIQEKTLDKHSDLFVRHQLLGYPHLNIKNGEVSLKSVTNAPFGTEFEIDISNLTKLDDWKYSSMGVATWKNNWYKTVARCTNLADRTIQTLSVQHWVVGRIKQYWFVLPALWPVITCFYLFFVFPFDFFQEKRLSRLAEERNVSPAVLN